jgi:hypothetical protein
MSDDAKPARRREAPAQSQDGAAASATLLEGSQHAFARWTQALFALSKEITQFTQARLQEDMAAWSTFAACRSPEEAVDWQRRFAAKATEQYAEEISKLSQMMIGMAGESLSQPQHRPRANA